MKIICITGSNGGIASQIQTRLLKYKNVKIYGCSRKKFKFKHKNFIHDTLDTTNNKSVNNWFKKIYLKEKKIDICKIDIQGEELNVLMGMQKYLKKKKIKLIKVEITIRNDYDNNKNQFVEIINLLKKYNYNLVTISKIKFSQNEIMFLDAYFQ